MFLKLKHYHIDEGGWKSFTVDLNTDSIAVFNLNNGKIILKNNKVIDIFGPNKEDSEEARSAASKLHDTLMGLNLAEIARSFELPNSPQALSKALKDFIS